MLDVWVPFKTRGPADTLNLWRKWSISSPPSCILPKGAVFSIHVLLPEPNKLSIVSREILCFGDQREARRLSRPSLPQSLLPRSTLLMPTSDTLNTAQNDKYCLQGCPAHKIYSYLHKAVRTRKCYGHDYHRSTEAIFLAMASTHRPRKEKKRKKMLFIILPQVRNAEPGVV